MTAGEPTRSCCTAAQKTGYVDLYAPTALGPRHSATAWSSTEDYEYFAMLDREIRKASARGMTGPVVEEARRLLENLPARVLDARARRPLLSTVLDAGHHSVTWDGRDDHGRELATGVYTYRLQAGQQVDTRKLLLLK